MVANMAENERQRELPTMILFISKHFSDITKVWIESLASWGPSGEITTQKKS